MDLSQRTSFDVGGRKPLGLELAPFLEREIITRRLQPGEKLVELDLCARFGVSRSPMREALRLLEASLLVTRRPRYGVRVAPMTLANLDHIYACRAPLEALAAAAIATTPERGPTVAALTASVGEMRAAAAAGDVERCFFANVELTDVLHAASDNPVLAAMLAQIDKAALRYRHWAFCEAPSMIALSIDANSEMVAAIAAGDPERAERVTRGLVVEAWTLLRRTFGASVPSAPADADERS